MCKKASSKTVTTSVSLSFILFLFVSFSLFAQDESEAPQYDPATLEGGESLWKANCTQCHAIGRKVIGPDLKNVEQRRPTDFELAQGGVTANETADA